MSRWFRYYDEALDDPKVQKLSGDMFKAWVSLLCLASRGGGKIKCEDVAFGLRVKPAQAAKIMVDLGQSGLIDAHDGFYAPHNWGKRQYKSDVTDPTNAARQKRYRTNHSNGTVTEKTVTDKRPDTEADTEQKKEIDSAGARGSKIRLEAHSISDDCYRALGIDLEAIPPEWCGLAYQIDMLLARGYDPSLITATFARLKSSPLKAVNYFIRAVESAQPIKQAGPVPHETVQPKTNIVAAAERLQQRLTDFDRPGRAAVRSGAGEATVRLLPER